MKLTISSQVAEVFPRLGILATVAKDVKVEKADQALRSFIEGSVREVRERYSGDPSQVRSLSSLRIYDDLLKRTGEDKIRSAVESMIRRVARGDTFPSINNVVDLCNLVMVQTTVAVGAFDLDKLTGDMVLRIGKRGERFLEIGKTEPRELIGGEIVLSDQSGVFSIIAYRDSDRTKITNSTRNVLLFTAADSEKSVREASHTLRVFIGKFCGGRVG